MKKLILAVLTLASLSSYASPQFHETAELAERYVISYEKGGKLSRDNTKTIISLFAKETREEINRLVKKIKMDGPLGVTEARIVYSKSSSLFDKIEKKFPAKKGSEMTQLGDEMVEVCKEENLPRSIPQNRKARSNYVLAETLCEISGKAVKYLRKSNF